jgi:serine/threonine-protein kinase RsbW
MDSRQFEVRLPAVPASPAAARDSIEESLRLTLTPTRLEQIRIVISELVTNAIRHAQMSPTDTIEVLGSIDPTALRVEVLDRGPGFEPRRNELGDPDTGWGLYILDHLADRWGTTPNDPSSVWFEMDLDAPANQVPG